MLMEVGRFLFYFLFSVEIKIPDLNLTSKSSGDPTLAGLGGNPQSDVEIHSNEKNPGSLGL